MSLILILLILLGYYAFKKQSEFSLNLFAIVTGIVVAIIVLFFVFSFSPILGCLAILFWLLYKLRN